jgi:hypothetical protein
LFGSDAGTDLFDVLHQMSEQEMPLSYRLIFRTAFSGRKSLQIIVQQFF